jgi:hypothetical protein
MCNGNDENATRLDSVNDGVRKSPEQKPTCAVIVRRPRLWGANNRVFGCVDFVAER